MITKVVHEETGATDPAGISLALAVANEIHAPLKDLGTPAATRAPEVVVPQLMGLRTSAAQTRRHRVPLKRLTALRA